MTELITSATVDRKAGSSTVRLVLWTSTSSVCGARSGKAFLRTWSALCDWPTPASLMSICLKPTTMFPNAKRTMTQASQPNTAIFQWRALQAPIRPAMFIARCICAEARSGILCRLGGGSS